MIMNFERGLTKLKSKLQDSHRGRLNEFSTLEARLRDNLDQERQHGTTETIRATRSQILSELNRLTLDTHDGITFNDLCRDFDLPTRQPRFVWLFSVSRSSLSRYRDWLRSRFEKIHVFGTANLLDIYATLKLVEDSQVAYGSIPSAVKRLDIEEVLPARRVVILGEPGSGKTTLLKHLALRLTLADVALGSVVRTLSPHPLGKHIDNLHTGLLYVHHPGILRLLFSWFMNLLTISAICFLVALFASVCTLPSVWVDSLKLTPLTAEQQKGAQAMVGLLVICAAMAFLLLGVLSLLVILTEKRDRVDRFAEALRLHFATFWPVPIFVRLSDFAKRPCDFGDYLITTLRDAGVSLDRRTLDQFLAREEIWVLCDGLDETGSKRNYWTVQQLITAFADQYPSVPLVITCRTAAFDRHSLHDFARYSIDKLDDEQIRTLVEKWFHAAPRRGIKLIQNLRTSPRIRALAANPFLLSIIAGIFERSDQLPQHREALYHTTVRYLLWTRDIEKDQEPLYKAELKQRVLTEVAYELHRKEDLSISAAELHAYLKQIEPDVHSCAELVTEIEERTGLLYRISETEYAFRHLGIQEYFASLAVADHPDRIERLITQIEEPWWREVVVLLVCQKTAAPQLLDALAKGSQVSTDGLLLAMACLNEGANLPASLRSGVIARAVDWLRCSEDYFRLQEIGGLDIALGDELWAEVAGWLRQHSPEIRLRALSIAALIQGDRALSTAIVLAVDDPNAEVRQAATTALIKMDEVGATEQLVAATWSSSNFGQRQRVAETIARLGDRACQRLTALLRTPDIKLSVRTAVAEVLDSIMVEVPGGEFTIGANSGNPDEGPSHVVLVRSFWIDKYAVTNAQYSRFLNATGYRAPHFWSRGKYPQDEEGFPVTGVSWYDARAYAEWIGKRLPTEAEWEIAARGVDGRGYPWGDKFEKNNCNWFMSSSGGKLTPVGSFPQGVSPFGAHDMVGNSWEWVEDWYQPYPGSLFQSENFGQKYKVMRGGAANLTLESDLRCTCRLYDKPEEFYNNVGFRCARNASAQS
jgi:formylglycine-generating enzyme required for sulfatase activity